MGVTILYDEQTARLESAEVEGEHLWLSPESLAAATGWKLEEEGLCKGDACVRTEQGWIDANGRVDLAALAGHLGQPVVREEVHNTWAFGESVGTRRDELFSLMAPDFTLPDLEGRMHSLSDYRGKKVFLWSWGSY